MMNLKKKQDKSSAAPIFLIALFVVAMFATSNLCHICGTAQAAGEPVTKFVEVGYWSYSEYPFTGISCSISTSQIITRQGSWSMTADWIAIWAYDNDHVTEFIQIGTLAYSGYEQLVYAFWATNGPVQSTAYRPRNITSLAVGSVHAYDLNFDGTGWSLRFDGSQVAYISFPHQAYRVQVDHETRTETPADPGLINSGITTFSDIYFKADTVYPFLTDFSKWTSPTYFSHSFSFNVDAIDCGNNGLQYLSLNSLQIGWGLPTTGLYGYTAGYGTNTGTQEPFLATLLSRYWLLMAGGVGVIVIFTLARRHKHR